MKIPFPSPVSGLRPPNELVRVRFAPSPTGNLHIGSARTALFNYLFARHTGGRFVLRIEDTDRERSKDEYTQNILEGLQWLGLARDEGPHYQSQRLSLYDSYAEKLKKAGLLYPCYCTEAELEKRREAALKRGEAPKYDGRCRSLTLEQKEGFEKEGRKSSFRFKVSPKEITVEDLIKGSVTFDMALVGDFVAIKSDGYPSYNFAVVVDDLEMGITHVIRGEDHLSNTPRQILIYQVLQEVMRNVEGGMRSESLAPQLKTPVFAHIPMILGPDRSKLSKRHGATSVVQYKEEGYLPEAIVNYLSLLGWSAPEGQGEVFPLEEIARLFDLSRVAHSNAVFDIDKLNWMNGQYIKKLDAARYRELAVPYLEKAVYRWSDPVWIDGVLETAKEELHRLDEVAEKVKLFFEELDESVIPWQEVDREKAIVALSSFMDQLESVLWEEKTIQQEMKQLSQLTQLKGKELYMPLRLALTGSHAGPELYKVIYLFGKEKSLERLKKAVDRLMGKI